MFHVSAEKFLEITLSFANIGPQMMSLRMTDSDRQTTIARIKQLFLLVATYSRPLIIDYADQFCSD
jgi:hypothetical protein